jgi:hypothetical protein
MALPSRKAILLFGIVNAALFSALVPLWEGFDEAFHYGYVESLWQTGRLPVLGRTLLPEDVIASFRLAPVSHVVARVIPEATSYETWFALPQAERERRRRDLELLSPRPQITSRTNYEAHHPPLAYLLLAPLDWCLSKFPLPVRVLILRLVCAVCSVVLLFMGASALWRTLELPEPFATTALFTVFCSEMLYATTAHVANDWLAVGVSALFLAELAAFVNQPGRRSALRAAAWLAAGLLTKAYFLVFAVLAVLVAGWLLARQRTPVRAVLPGAVLVLLVAGPWYLRNLALYGNLSGTQEAFDGIGVRQALAVAPRIDWLATSGYLARGSLWTGNNWFNSYSRTTLDLMLALLGLGVAAWCVRRRAVRPAERAIVGAVLLLSVGVAYASCAAFADRGGATAGASPWYTQVLLAPVVALAYLGLSRWQRMGAALAAISLALWTWVLVATWTSKLFPMYSGGGSAAMRVRDVWNWWTHGAAAHARDLSLTALAPAAWLHAGLVASLALTVVLSGLLIRALAKGWAS